MTDQADGATGAEDEGATAETAPRGDAEAATMDERVALLEQHVGAALTGAQGCAEIAAALAAAVEELRGHVDELGARVEELGAIAFGGVEATWPAHVGAEPPPGERTEDHDQVDAPGLPACRSCGRLNAEGAEKCSRCGSTL